MRTKAMFHDIPSRQDNERSAPSTEQPNLSTKVRIPPTFRWINLRPQPKREARRKR